MTTARSRTARRTLVRVAVGTVVLVAGLGVGWSAATVLRPASDPATGASFTLVEVTEGEVGSSVTLNITAEWGMTPVAVNQTAGTVTAVTAAPGAEVAQGSVLYLVDERPVVVAAGEVPAFRTIAPGDVGTDVTQLQAMLTALGTYRGAVDGKAGASTVAAVKAWQQTQGIAPTGTVELGAVLFVPALPTRVVLDAEAVTRGATLDGGEPVVSALSPSPTFTLPVTSAQAALMPPGTRVVLTGPQGQQWSAVTGDQKPDPQGEHVTISVNGPDGQPACGHECDTVPVGVPTSLTASVVTVEPVSGLVVPTAALVTGADGAIGLVAENGTRIAVRVEATARGESVVVGVASGTAVRVPGEADSDG